MGEETGIRWSTFKIIISLLLVSLAFTFIYLIVSPIVEGERSAKDLANLIFGVLIVIIMCGIVKVKENKTWVFWACSFGLVLFATSMFVFYEKLFE